MFSYCVWGQGITSLLPRTDRVMLLSPDSQLVADGSWEQLQAIAGDLIEQLDMYPPRYRVSEFPTEEQFAIIGA